MKRMITPGMGYAITLLILPVLLLLFIACLFIPPQDSAIHTTPGSWLANRSGSKPVLQDGYINGLNWFSDGPGINRTADHGRESRAYDFPAADNPGNSTMKKEDKAKNNYSRQEDWVPFSKDREELPQSFYGERVYWKINSDRSMEILLTDPYSGPYSGPEYRRNGSRIRYLNPASWDRFILGMDSVYYIVHNRDEWYRTFHSSRYPIMNQQYVSNPDYSPVDAAFSPGNTIRFNGSLHYDMPFTTVFDNPGGLETDTVSAAKEKNVQNKHIKTQIQRFITVNRINDIINIFGLVRLHSGNIEEPYMKVSQFPELFHYIGNGQLLSVKSGYSIITIIANKQRFISSVFVSPVPSKHSNEPLYNWYKTQFATGLNGNCGPACVAMAIHWATGEDIPVAKVRSEIGVPIKNGAIGFSHMFPSLKKRGIHTFYTSIDEPGDINNIINRGNIAIIVFDTRDISKTKGDRTKNLFGRYYNDLTGHYCIIKGYSLDGKYFIVYDPIPSSWWRNSARYADGMSMIGKNRYYPVSELFETMAKRVLEIKQGRRQK